MVTEKQIFFIFSRTIYKDFQVVALQSQCRDEHFVPFFTRREQYTSDSSVRKML